MPPTVLQWILDTRYLWPEATETAHLETLGARALSLVLPDERDKVLKYVHVRDAKLCLGSCLLKRYAISRYCSVSWREANMSRDARTKPVFVDAERKTPLAFNVSHQDGLVVLAGVHGYEGSIDVGVDVVSPSERRKRDHETIVKEGWAAYVDIFADVFAPGELNYLKYRIQPSAVPGLSKEEQMDFRLRYFYALWCLREAYVKMTGEALLAPWIRDLQFRNFRPPSKRQGVELEDGVEGSAVSDFDISIGSNQVQDVNIQLRSLPLDYMVCTSVRTTKASDGLELPLGPFTMIDMDRIIEYAVEHLGPDT